MCKNRYLIQNNNLLSVDNSSKTHSKTRFSWAQIVLSLDLGHREAAELAHLHGHDPLNGVVILKFETTVFVCAPSSHVGQCGVSYPISANRHQDKLTDGVPDALEVAHHRHHYLLLQ